MLPHSSGILGQLVPLGVESDAKMCKIRTGLTPDRDLGARDSAE
jgi:hypothetical protein